ncbi:MAG: SRPBCC domain-containing protein, partial [Acidobacteria bacterium]|nr:SRPBCC domain-containing protein [Acidobacteriota bacterium]
MLTPNTFVLTRTFRKPPEKVFAAFSDPDKKRRWMASGHDHQVDHYTSDFRVGGHDAAQYRLSDKTPFPGVIMTSDEIYLDIV